MESSIQGRHSGKKMEKLVTPHLQSKSSGQMGNEVELTMSKPPSDSTRLPSMNVLQASITSPSTGNQMFKHRNLQGTFTLKPQNRVLLTQGCLSLGSTKKAPSSDIWGTFPRKLECKDSWAWSWEMVLSFRSATNSLCDPGQRGTVPYVPPSLSLGCTTHGEFFNCPLWLWLRSPQLI